MAAPTYQIAKGFQGNLVLQPGAKTVAKRNGISELTEIYMSNFDPGIPFVPLYTPYPSARTGGYVCDSCTVESLAGGFWKTTVVWVDIYVGPTQFTTYDSKLIQVPIAQSPDFVNIAGFPGQPLNNAVFDANGQFVGFGPGPFQGVVSAFVTQNLMIVSGSGYSPGVVNGLNFCESIVNTLRGGVWEYTITYNLSINTQNGTPVFTVD